MKDNKQIIVTAQFKFTISPKDKTVIIRDRTTGQQSQYNMNEND